jgi:heat shock protein HslJ
MIEERSPLAPGATETGPFATTRMACQPETMLSKRQFLTMLGIVSYAEGTHLKLLLKDGSGDVLAELVRRDPN